MSRIRAKTRTPRRRAGAAKPKGDWLRSIRIRNFRGIRDLNVDGLAPITVFTGDNGAGKTTLLEAAFAIHGRGNPQWVVDLQARRGFPHVSAKGPSYLGLFGGFEEFGEAEITGKTGTGKKPGIQLSRSSSDGHAAVVRTDSPAPISAGQTPPPLVCHALSKGAKVHPSRLVWHFEPPNKGSFEAKGAKKIGAPAILMHAAHGAAGQDEEGKFAEARVAGRDESIIANMRLLDPRIEYIESVSARGGYFGVRFSKRRGVVPLGMLGGGANNFFKFMVNLDAVRGGWLGIDEVENGFFHRRQPELFKNLFIASRAANVQLMLATHSHEALGAMIEAVPKSELSDLAVVHLRRESDDEVRATVLPGPRARSSYVHGYDLR